MTLTESLKADAQCISGCEGDGSIAERCLTCNEPSRPQGQIRHCVIANSPRGTGRDAQTLLTARRRFLSDGVIPRGISLPVLRSWRRSAARGLDPEMRPKIEHSTRHEMREALQRNETLIQAAWGEVETLCRDAEPAGGIVVLTDPNGLVLLRVGDGQFAEQASAAALHPGANWSEDSVGTSAIGVSLVEQGEISVFGAEHFLSRHSCFSCSAMPIFGPDGAVAGVLDLSTPHDVSHAYSLALVRRAVEQVERRLFERRFGKLEQMHLHSNPYLVGGPHEGLLAFDGERLIGANRNAINLLGLAWSAVGAMRFDQLFSVERESIGVASDNSMVQTTRGSTLFARMQTPPGSSHSAAPVPAARRQATDAEWSVAEEPEAREDSESRTIVDRLMPFMSSGQFSMRKLKAGRLIYGFQDLDDDEGSLMVVRSGRIRSFASFEGKELTLFTLDAGDAMILHDNTMLEVKKDAEILVVRSSVFRQLVKADPELALQIVPEIERRLGKSIRMIEEMAFHGVRYRLVRTLCETADRDGRKANRGIVIDIAPHGEDLAMQIGATRQTVSTVIAELVRGGILQRNGNTSIIIPDINRLKAELDLPK
ncbi:helix-turn-helix domain-containing protein [Consotaella salsifontis]|uniref:GAF domain-containing protein n=1 Tax=Consotaella salsifontis TaxID=1365950 RepID=A0A1T4LF36_9HYPH|nr:helix-turn-helix domain-containing protein [Consotaella salsifontis]SJZ53236.1 GAF domain-containing protein [Consotaella salsifontis]